MKFDFTTWRDRRGLDAMSVDFYKPDGESTRPYPGLQIKEGFDLIPMWVADMNFAVPPAMQNAMISRLQHPTYGYFQTRDEYYDAVINWQKTRNGVENLTKDDIGYEQQILGGVSSALRVLCSAGDPVLVHSPLYIGFKGVLTAAGYKIIDSPLKKDENGVWRMDYEDMDRKLKENGIHAAIFCSPQNPTGRCWERWELEKAAEVYAANDCFVICDEVWSDLILPGHKHIPFQSASEWARNSSMTLYGTTKTFNAAGIQGAYRICFNRTFRDRLAREEALTHYSSMNLVYMYAQIGGYSEEGAEWVDELQQVLGGNIDYAYDFIVNRFDGVKVSKPEATYLLYLDVSEWLQKHSMKLDELLRRGAEYGVIWQDGSAFLIPDTIRMNLAIPFEKVRDAFDRLDRYVFNA